MSIAAKVTEANETVLYREVKGASFLAWVWRELHTARSVAGDDRAAILLVQDGAETIAMMTNEDLDALIRNVHEEGVQM